MSLPAKKQILFLLIPLLAANGCDPTGCCPTTCRKPKKKKEHKNITFQKHKLVRTPNSNNVGARNEIEPDEKPSIDTSIPMEPESDDSVSNEINGAENGSEQPTNIGHSDDDNDQGPDSKKPAKNATPKKESMFGRFWKKVFGKGDENKEQPKENSSEASVYDGIVDDMTSKPI